MIVISVERHRFLQQRRDQTHAEAVVPSQTPQVGRLVYLYKEYTTHDADGNPTGRCRDRNGQVTVLRTEGPIDLGDVRLETAMACGHRTRQGFQEAWQGRHPRSPLVSVVWFALGDWRDRDLFMNFTGQAGGDYTRNARRALDSDAPVLTREQIEALAAVNYQKDQARRAATAAALARNPSSERLQRLLEQANAKVIRQEIRVIEQRIKRAERRQ